MRTSNDTVLRRAWSALTAALMLMLAPAASAEISVAILDFELNDITGLRRRKSRDEPRHSPLLRDGRRRLSVQSTGSRRCACGSIRSEMGRSWNVAEIELSVRLRHRTGFECHDKATDRRVQYQARRADERRQDHPSRHAADRGPGRCRDQGRIAQPSSGSDKKSRSPEG